MAKRSAETIDIWDILEGGVVSWEAESTCVEAPASGSIAGFVFGPNRDLFDGGDDVHFPSEEILATAVFVDTRRPPGQKRGYAFRNETAIDGAICKES